jgi:hypothetical protein
VAAEVGLDAPLNESGAYEILGELFSAVMQPEAKTSLVTSSGTLIAHAHYLVVTSTDEASCTQDTLNCLRNAHANLNRFLIRR